jgi:hypothetical protein
MKTLCVVPTPFSLPHSPHKHRYSPTHYHTDIQRNTFRCVNLCEQCRCYQAFTNHTDSKLTCPRPTPTRAHTHTRTQHAQTHPTTLQHTQTRPRTLANTSHTMHTAHTHENITSQTPAQPHTCSRPTPTRANAHTRTKHTQTHSNPLEHTQTRHLSL